MSYNLNQYRLPAEWEPHKATWLSWPHNPGTWDMEQLVAMYPAYAEFVSKLSRFEEVHININNDSMKALATQLIEEAKANMDNVFFHYFPTNDAWCRDHGPDFVKNIINGEKLVLNWGYNSWGGKYPPFDLDNKIPELIADFRDCDILTPNMILEGGSYDVNGVGDLLTTKQCLLNPNRNPQYSQEKIGHNLEHHFAVDNIIWLDEGIVGDDTDGHVDDITRFVNEDTIITVIEPSKFDINHNALAKNLQTLKKARLANGKQPTIIEIELPKPVKLGDEYLPASYANFYIANNQVIVPIYNDAKDDMALRKLEEAFPDREVVGIYSGDIIIGLGSFHCLSKQEPL